MNFRTAALPLAIAATLAAGIAPEAQAFTIGSGATQINGALSLGCPAAVCTDLKTAGYQVTGGDVATKSVAPVYKTPGEWEGDSSKVTSYSLTSGEAKPTAAALTDIVVTSLNNKFSFYWGSVDTHNRVQFFLGNTLVNTVTGTTLAGTQDWKNLGLNTSKPTRGGGNYREDVYVDFTGIFDKVVLSTTPFRYHDGVKDGVAFEVAATAVPEPSTLLMVGGALALAGKMKRRQLAE
jgi:hypothetical protein